MSSNNKHVLGIEGGGGCFWKLFCYLCRSWGMGAEGDPFRNPGGGVDLGRLWGKSTPVWDIILLPDHKG
jgi:hypothetical protein